LSRIGSLSTSHFAWCLLARAIILVLHVARSTSTFRLKIRTFKIGSRCRSSFRISNRKHFQEVYLLFIWNIKCISAKVLIKIVLFFHSIHRSTSINKWQRISTITIFISKLVPPWWCLKTFIYKFILFNLLIWLCLFTLSMWRTLLNITKGFLSFLVLVLLWTWWSMVVEIVVK
jgi:hypothetical protein